MTGIYYFFNHPYEPDLKKYAKYNLHGNNFYNLGVDYKYRLGKLVWVGEGAVGKQGYANADLYSDTESAQVEQKERSLQNFVEYFNATAKKRHAKSSDSIRVNWKRAYELIKLFVGDTLPFSKIDNRFAEDFKLYLLSAPCGGNKSGTISRDTAVTYFSIFKAALKQAFVDGYLTTDLSAKIKGIRDLVS